MERTTITLLYPQSDMIDGPELYDAMGVKCEELGINKKDWWVVSEHFYSKDNYTTSDCWIDIECVNERPNYKDDAEFGNGIKLDPRRHSLEHWGKPFWME